MLTVVGPGAVGGLLAALLHRQGQAVLTVGRPDAAARIARDGLRVRSAMFGDFRADVGTAVAVPPDAHVLLAVKAQGLLEALSWLAAARPRSVTTVLNGVEHGEVLRSGLPGSRVLCGAVTVEAARSADGTVEHRSPFLRFALPRAARDGATALALADAGVETHVGGDETAVLWRKFRFLAPMALLTARWQRPLGPSLARDRVLTDRVVEEVSALATSEGLATDPADLRAQLDGFPPTMRSSLQRDLADGVPNELDAVGGALLRRAARRGVPLPAIAGVVEGLIRRAGSGVPG